MPNKYPQIAELQIDLHGYTKDEAKTALDKLLRERKYKHVRVITGRGNNSANGPVLPNFVRMYLMARGARCNQAKIAEGGEGALEVFFR